MRIGIFGGSFNPIHNGHVALGRTMLSAMSLDEVWYMVSPQNPLKQDNGDLAPEEIRLRLATLALENESGLQASDYEFHLPRPSYTWDTLQSLSVDYPQNDFILIIGGDNWDCFDRWAHYKDILKNYEVAVYPRKQNPSHALHAGKSKSSGTCNEMRCENDAKVTFVDMPLMDISSTEVRRMIRLRQDISHLVPLQVALEVEKTSLYR